MSFRVLACAAVGVILGAAGCAAQVEQTPASQAYLPNAGKNHPAAECVAPFKEVTLHLDPGSLQRYRVLFSGRPKTPWTIENSNPSAIRASITSSGASDSTLIIDATQTGGASVKLSNPDYGLTTFRVVAATPPAMPQRKQQAILTPMTSCGVLVPKISLPMDTTAYPTYLTSLEPPSGWSAESKGPTIASASIIRGGSYFQISAKKRGRTTVTLSHGAFGTTTFDVEVF